LESLRGELYKAKVKLLSERENLKRFETLFEDEDIAKVYLFTNQSEGVSFSDLQNHLNLDPKLLRRQLNQLVQKEIIRFDSVKQKYFRDDRLVHTHLKNASPSDARFTQMVDTFSRFQREFTKYYASPVGVADPNRPYVFRLMSRVPRAEFQRLKDRFRTVIDEFLSEVNYLERNAPMEDSVFVEFLGGQMLSDKNE
jgi:succinate dehydrogenase flavin-adding protein (antitoxin of CptAB toxin-antitoxin module)